MNEELANGIMKLVIHQISKQCLRKAIKNEKMPIGFYKTCRSKGIYLNTRYQNPFDFPSDDELAGLEAAIKREG